MRKTFKKLIAITTVVCMAISLALPGIQSNAAGKWGSDANGWYYYDGGSYYAGQWAEIGGYWYYFLSSGYMDYSEYRDGCWLGPDGIWNTAYSNGQWKVNSDGWWYEDNGWYASDQWLWINGYCYHFAESGYMEYNCYRDGCWLGADGAWMDGYSGSWKGNDTGWWFEDSSGWYPSNQGLWINGEYYWFNADGYWDKEETEKKKASGAAGRPSSSTGNGSAGSGSGTSTPVEYGEYSYQIFAMLPPFNDYFYIKTDNPDPESFSFIDKSTKYSDSTGAITPSSTTYSDVKYENVSTRRVKGGYIGVGSYTDGGELVLEARTVTGQTPVYNLTTGQTEYRTTYDKVETNVKLSIGTLVDETDYLIQTYGGSASDYFGKMSAIQDGFSSICLYSGASIRGNLVKSTTYPYYGLSNSPHVDQNFYIQSPYSRKDGKKLLVSDLYPYRYDSIGFPSMMISVSKRIQPDATYAWSDSTHEMVGFTYGGTTQYYGGAGHGGGKQIMENQVNYWYLFDESSSDAYKMASLGSLGSVRDQLKYYGSLSVPDDVPTSDKLTWASVRSKVGTGSYVKLIAIYSIFGSSGTGYTYLYDNGSTDEGGYGFVGIGHFSNAWFEGRYYNRHEIIEKGVHYGDIAADGKDTKTATIVVKDAVIPVPNDGNTYRYNGSNGMPSNYNSSTGVWSGYTSYNYDSTTGNYIASQLNNVTYFVQGVGYKPCEDAAFIDACTLTPAEVSAMGVDKNTDIDPSSYFVYDKSTAPGTWVNGGN